MDQLLQPDKALPGILRVCAFLARQQFDGDQLRNGIRYFDSGKMFNAFFVADQHSQVQAQVRYMRKRAAGIKRQGRQRGENRLMEILV